MRLVDYHTHTTLCGHAEGTIDEYIASALEKGLEEIGFSDHAPIPLPQRSGITMEPDQTELYIAEIEKRKFGRTDIKVKLGFEVDFPLFETFEKKYFTDPRIDYLTGSCHFLGDWPFDHPEFIEEYSRRDIDSVYEDYYAVILSLVRSGLFNVIGHFDLVKKFGYRHTKNFGPTLAVLAREIAARDIAVEINTSGLLKPVREMYPAPEILPVLFNQNVPVTLGSDSHTPGNVGYGFEKAVAMLEKAGYKKISGFSGRKRYDLPL